VCKAYVEVLVDKVIHACVQTSHASVAEVGGPAVVPPVAGDNARDFVNLCYVRMSNDAVQWWWLGL